MPHSKRLVIAAGILFALSAGPVLAQETAPAAEPAIKPAQVETDQPAGQASPQTAPSTQDTPPAPKGPAQAKPKTFWEQWGLFVILMAVFVIFYGWMGRSKRKQESKTKEMLSNLKKGDEITTIGGIVGKVIETRDNEIVIKVDETNNVRMKFARWAIRNVGERPKGDSPPEENK